MTKPRKNSLAVTVVKEAGKDILGYLKSLGRGVISNKLKAMVASSEYVGPTWTKRKGESVQRALASLDIKSERQAKNYVNAGRVIITSQMTEEEAVKTGLSRIMQFATKLLEDEAASTPQSVERFIREYEGELEKKRAKKEEEEKARKAEKRQQSVESMKELLNEEFDEDEGVTDTRTWAHVTVFADYQGVGKELRAVCGENAHTGLKKLFSLVVAQYKADEKARKEEAKKQKAAAK